MENVVVKFLSPEEYYLLEDFCKQEGIPMLNPEWSKVVVALDTTTNKIVGIMVAQMQIHVEPIWIKKGYRDGKISTELADTLDGYLDTLSFTSGQPIGVWANPSNAAARRICTIRGFQQCLSPVYTKIYTGDKIADIFWKNEEE